MAIFFSSRGAYIKLRYIAILYTHSIGNQPYNTMVVFKMRDSVPSASYSSVCNVLRQWNIPLIPTLKQRGICLRVCPEWPAMPCMEWLPAFGILG